MTRRLLPELWPTPKLVEWQRDALTLGQTPGFAVHAEPETYAASVLRRRLPTAGDGVPIHLRVDPAVPSPADLDPLCRPELYLLTVTANHLELVAPEPEGLLRGAATLLQLAAPDPARIPCVSILDWPDIRFRGAADWLLNAEINRWAYDWGDGPAEFRDRLERRLDLCFEHKINQVWFDGFGWNLDRFPGYADLLRYGNALARERGIRLVHCGYGGGYGTAYQKSELYRAGYQGQVFLNRRPWPDGPEYDCCGGLGVAAARRYGTCLSNAGLRATKVADLAAFVERVQPGLLYVHDIDAGTWRETQEGWLQRCDECRRRWPSDQLDSDHGQAAAMADWFRQLRQALDAVPGDETYQPVGDLTVVFTSPLYTTRTEPGQPGIWGQEVRYFQTLSRLLGPAEGVQFGIREQLLDPSGEPRVGQLRRALDEIGHQHGVHVLSFAGGDTYQSDDLVNLSGVLAPLYRGAAAVDLCNGGLFEEPVQILNADFLWSGSAQGYRERPTTAPEADALFANLVQGRHRPATVVGEGGLLERACRRVWGSVAAGPLRQALLAGGDGHHGPVCRVWWTVTREVRRLRGDLSGRAEPWPDVAARWERRLAATREAAACVAAARQTTDHPDLTWLARCLAVGERFAAVVALAAAWRATGEPAARRSLATALGALDVVIEARPLEPVDLLGGDPGCWAETAGHLRQATLG